jgi:threonyl-tRNA synthetase
MNEQEKLEIKRHSLAHVLATAVLEMFPEAKFGVGPAIENGFYYDFDLPRTLIPEDLPLLEKKMKEIIGRNFPFEKEIIAREKAVELFQKAGQNYKVEILSDEANEEEVSVYRTGNFVDLCRGPHLDSTGEIDASSFKLTKTAGAYWRGDEKNKMLQRIYGVAFENKEKLKEFEEKQAEAEKRDHRKIGKELELFLIDQNVGQGLVMWQPKGAMLWRIIEDFWYKEHLRSGYQLVRTPHIGSRKLWETSGHWNFYNESMYPPLEVGLSLEESQKGVKSENKEEYLLKPMNCPFHVSIYNVRQRSYKELPLRWAECGTVYRYEKSGELSGLTRVRGFTQDDAHIICTQTQVEEELKRVIRFIQHIFKSFGFKEYKVYLSLRDPKDKKHYAGTDEGWDFAQGVLEKVAKEEKLDYVAEEGEAAFYGPKLDYKIKDCMGREWQCSTLQFDFNLPERFDMSYINEKGEKERPYMLHRALFGSFERFMGVLIEHYAGAFPVWFSPVQVKLLPVSSDKHMEYTQKIFDLLTEENIRVEIDDSNESIGKKIREAENEKVPYMLVLGDKEIEAGAVAVRQKGSREITAVKTEEFIAKLKQEIKDRL